MGKNRLSRKIILFVLLVLTVFVGLFFGVSKRFDLPTHIISLFLAFILLVAIIINMAKEEGKRAKEDIVVDDTDKKYTFNNKRCVKCGKPYDGITCFYCGYHKEEK